MKGRLSFGLIFALLVLTLAVSVAAASGPYTVYASVTTGSGAIQATLVPGEFTVPAGKTASIVKFQHDNPSSGYHSEKLGKNIYSVTQNAYMVDGNGNALLQLPPGQYRFFVGGSPGATGILVYNLLP